MACDTEVSHAVRTGLIEFCLQSLAKSSVHVTEVDRLLSTVGMAVFQPKTLKAIKKQASFIREALHAFKGRVPQAQVDHICGLLDKASFSPVPASDPKRDMQACRSCLQSFEKGGAKKCAGCKRASYCSRVSSARLETRKS